MTGCGCGADQPDRIIKRAHEGGGWPAAWADEAIVECRGCGQRRVR